MSEYIESAKNSVGHIVSTACVSCDYDFYY